MEEFAEAGAGALLIVDLGAIATEYFLLGIDPYPRKPGAEFQPTGAGDGGAKPFAALAALKKLGPGDKT